MPTIHGKSHSRVYKAFVHMHDRCKRSKCSEWHLYGARGITVCERWSKFENFYADMGDPPIGKSLDRIDSNGNYSPENCRWATSKQQCNNTRRNRYYTFNGNRLTIAEIAEKTEISYMKLYKRLAFGYSIEDAVAGTNMERGPR